MKIANIVLSILILLFAAASAVFSYFLSYALVFSLAIFDN